MSSPRKVLVVEDHPDILYLASKKLRAAGFDPIPAVNGVEAIRQMLDHPDCRLMVTDFMMPELGGDTWIRFLERFCADWTIAVVSSSQEADPGPFIQVPKPVDFQNLIHIFGGAR